MLDHASGKWHQCFEIYDVLLWKTIYLKIQRKDKSSNIYHKKWYITKTREKFKDLPIKSENRDWSPQYGHKSQKSETVEATCW